MFVCVQVRCSLFGICSLLLFADGSSFWVLAFCVWLFVSVLVVDCCLSIIFFVVRCAWFVAVCWCSLFVCCCCCLLLFMFLFVSCWLPVVGCCVVV